MLRLFVPPEDISDAALHRLITVDAFAGFATPDIVRNKRLYNGTNVLELWHGPTLAFKDLGMQVLCKLLQYYLDTDADPGKVLNLLVGTSGDTGSSAIEAVKDLPNVTITVLYPKGKGITLLQELQMTTVGEIENNGVHVIGVDGSSDDLDRPMEVIFNDVAFKHQHNIGSVNSVNIARVLVQIAHYIWAAVVVGGGEKASSSSSSGGSGGGNTVQNIHFYVPTGAGGHVSAGVMAKRMLRELNTVQLHLHVATNSNDVFHRILHHGDSSLSAPSTFSSQSSSTTPTTACAKEAEESIDLTPGSTPVVSTVSPSMDIQIPYNLERLLWMGVMFNDDSDEQCKINQCIESSMLMKDFKQTERIHLDATIRERLIRWCGIAGSSAHSDTETKDTILQVYQRSSDKYVLDPHTAIGVHASMVDPNRNPTNETNEIVFCMACAHPSKFPVAIAQALAGVQEGGDDKWWWLSDSTHSSVKKLLDLEGKHVLCEEYEKNSNWVDRLREHFVQQSNAAVEEKAVEEKAEEKDPYAKSQARVCTHMNDDHESSLLAYLHHFADQKGATGARLVSFDQEGMTIHDESESVHFVKYSSGPLSSPRDAHHVLVAMHKEAFLALGFRYRLEHGYYQFVAAMIFAGLKKKVIKNKIPIAIATVAVGVGVAVAYTHRRRKQQ